MGMAGYAQCADLSQLGLLSKNIEDQIRNAVAIKQYKILSGNTGK